MDGEADAEAVGVAEDEATGVGLAVICGVGNVDANEVGIIVGSEMLSSLM